MTSEMLYGLHKAIDRSLWFNKKLNLAATEWLMENGCKRHRMWVAVQVLKRDQVMIPSPWGYDRYRGYAPDPDVYLLVPRELAEKILVMGQLPELDKAG